MPKLDSSARQAAEQPRSVAPRNSNHQKPLGAMAIIVQGFGARQDPGLNANKKRRLYAPPRWVHHPSHGLRRHELEVRIKRPGSALRLDGSAAQPIACDLSDKASVSSADLM